MPDLLLLCRHMTRDDEKAVHAAQSRSRQARRSWRVRGEKGSPEASHLPQELMAVASLLAEFLSQQDIAVTAIWHAPSPIAAAHAELLASSLSGGPSTAALRHHDELAPGHFSTWSSQEPVDGIVQELTCRLRTSETVPNRGNHAVLVVGHMPQLGWIGSRLMRNRPSWRALVDGPTNPLGLKHAEVAAIALDGRRRGRPHGHLEWTIAPDETQAIADLREKIRSKMDVAKLLGGFMTLVLGGVLLAPDRLTDLATGGYRTAVAVAALSFLLAIGLYLRTMYAYDTLLMPVRYWGEANPGRRTPRWLVRRPPSGAAWVLYQNMLHVWFFLFTPATVAVGVGLLALSYAAFKPGLLEAAVSAIAIIVVAFYALRHRPILGSQD